MSILQKLIPKMQIVIKTVLYCLINFKMLFVVVFLLLFFFFHSVLRTFHDYFNTYDMIGGGGGGQSVGGAITGEPPRKNTRHTRKQCKIFFHK